MSGPTDRPQQSADVSGEEDFDYFGQKSVLNRVKQSLKVRIHRVNRTARKGSDRASKLTLLTNGSSYLDIFGSHTDVLQILQRVLANLRFNIWLMWLVVNMRPVVCHAVWFVLWIIDTGSSLSRGMGIRWQSRYR